MCVKLKNIRGKSTSHVFTHGLGLRNLDRPKHGSE